VEGMLTIHGVSQKITASGSMTITGGKPVLNGDVKIRIQDYGITGSYIGEKIASEAQITINCKYE